MILDLNLLNPNKMTMDNKNLALLELAADDDVERFKLSIENDPSAVDEGGPWYRRRNCSNLVALDLRTPLMVAAAYGSLRVLRLILAASDSDVNRSCGEDKTTALHCAASGGSTNVVETVRLLLSAGAEVGAVDAYGNRPGDVVMVSPGSYEVKVVLEELLGKKQGLRVATSSSSASSPVLSSSLDEDADSLSPSSGLASPPLARKDGTGRKEYPVDPSFPDIKNGIYASDEFRMFSFKVRPCSRAYSHDWTECPFVHPGENARRRDPRKYHYSCVPCPDFRKGACKKGNMCEYAHGVFECWLHPAQYRTRICKDGTACARRICFFAHTEEELRPLYVSTGSVVQAPRSSASAVEMAAAVMSMMPVSPSSLSVMSQNLFASPVSPSTNGMGSLGRQQPNVPTLHLPGSNYSQSSRLRSSLSARDIPVDDLTILSDFDEFCLKSSQARIGSFTENRMGRSMTINTPNLDEISSSPRYNSDQCAVFSPSHKSPALNQFQQQQKTMLSPTNPNSSFSLMTMDTQLFSGYNPLMHASHGVSLPGRMSPRCIDAHSP
ncbi:putative zinc finger CCCH domain-containing protein 24-like [Iris pallida]|uniref:Zinc finger CCCH domain-containing protein 24-like n=1 Tax=Iris pallida TaxID=29817 RepID=A0AAX6FIL6_IRIPA|nr:putative zinc finger CCCH domain-containing protein 24-like [Iris pallida]